jgi:urease accessory protein
MVPAELIVWQLADSAFPTGSFAHAGGLEAAAQLGEVRDVAGLAAYAEEALWNAGSFALPFVSAAHRDPAALPALDARCDGYTPSHVANCASRAQGQALLRAAGAAFGGPAAELAERIRRERPPGHLAPAAGAMLGVLGIPIAAAQRLVLFLALRGVLSAGVRLGLAGPLEAQGIQARLATRIEEIATACAGVGVEEVAQATPLLEVFQGHQDRLYSRLFQS